MTLEEHLNLYGIKFREDGDAYIIDGKRYYIISDELPLFNSAMEFEDSGITEENVIFEFGGYWYYSKYDNLEFNELLYLGNQSSKSKTFLGVHGIFDILNGSREYNHWVKKAKFLGLTSLAICEKDTLAGAMKFQVACLKENIKPIIGMQVSVIDNEEDKPHLINLYVQDEIGWFNLLKINTVINVHNLGKPILNDVLLGLMGGLTAIYNPNTLTVAKFAKHSRVGTAFNVGITEYKDPIRQLEYLNELKEWLSYDNLVGVMLTNAYYLESGDAYLKSKLRVMGKETIAVKSTNDYFHSYDDFTSYYMGKIFPDELRDMMEFTNLVADKCNFQIPTGSRNLPAYKMTQQEAETFSSNEDLFWELIGWGMANKVAPEDEKEYLARLDKEMEVINYGNVMEYFLILWDITSWARSQGILVGTGRGSAAGSLVSYLLNITTVDPIKFNLLFERFLNKGRVEKSLPDIDVDFSGKRRDEVKQYIIQKYGYNQFCSVGTYTNLKPKSLMKELGKMEGLEYQNINYITTLMPEVSRFKDLFVEAVKIPRLENFIKKNISVINDIRKLEHQPKAESIHACATIIVPDNMEIYEWIPVKVMNKGGEAMLVSQWEGEELEKAGFLKEDILGIAQLDKYEMILKLIKEDTGDIIVLEDIPLGEPEVMEYFQRGWNSDIFHFGSRGLTSYCKEMQPTIMEDLFAAISLYRPGPMNQGFHHKYVQRKSGKEEVEFPPHTEEILKDTYGILCLSGDSMVTTNKGLKFIKDVKIGDKVINEELKVDVVVNSFKSGNSEVLEIKCSFGDVIKCTPEHKLLTNNGWVKASDIKYGDLIKSSWMVGERVDYIDEKLALKHWLIGYYLAEGGGKSTPIIYCGTEELSLKIITIIKKVFPTSIPKYKYYKNRDRIGGTYRVSIRFKDGYNGKFSKDFKSNLFMDMLREYGIYDKNVYTKRLPKNYSIHMISGLIEGDGCLSNGTVRLANYNLNYDLFLALQSYRIFSNFIDKGSYCVTSIETTDKLVFRVLDRTLKGFKRYLPLNKIILSDKPNRVLFKRYFSKAASTRRNSIGLKTLDGFNLDYSIEHDLWSKVKKITVGKKQDVYDLTIKNKPSFLVNGMIVHNCYQEQVMKICQVVGGISEAETDNVRKSIVKKRIKEIEQYSGQFFDNAINVLNINEEEVDGLWGTLVSFADYGFNKSHAVAYSILSFYGQWFKVNYPLQYWATAFSFADDKKYPFFLYEINEIGGIQMNPVDINLSGEVVIANATTNSLYWSLNSVFGCGVKSYDQIVENRKDGEYLSFDNFLTRNVFKGSKVNKAVIENLILCGAFDRIEAIDSKPERLDMLEYYWEYSKIKGGLDNKKFIGIGPNLWWDLKQRELCGYSIIDFSDIQGENKVWKYSVNPSRFHEYGPKERMTCAGYVREINVRELKSGDQMVKATLDFNYQTFNVVLWSNTTKDVPEIFDNPVGKILVFHGKVKYDSYRDELQVQSVGNGRVEIIG